jgi:hypothetical protein
MKTIYTAPTTEIMNLISMGYICEGQTVGLGGSNFTNNGFTNTGDEAKQFTPLDNTDWPSYNLWDD